MVYFGLPWTNGNVILLQQTDRYPPKVMPASSPRKRWAFPAWVDSLGSGAALVCAIHCAALPFVLAVLPALGLGILASSGFEYGYVAFASVLALSSLWQGYRRHRVYRALAFLVPGLLAVWSGVVVPALHENVVRHAVVMTLGGTLIAVAHLINLRLTHGHVHDAGCAHGH
jgi:MerC mercury resistance protein